VVVETNDMPMPDGAGGIVRPYEVAQVFDGYRRDALNRALALEYARSLGITAVADDAPQDVADELDLMPEDARVLAEQEMILSQAHEWLEAADVGLGRVPYVCNYLRATGQWGFAKMKTGENK
jgi:hypothetical protein